MRHAGGWSCSRAATGGVMATSRPALSKASGRSTTCARRAAGRAAASTASSTARHTPARRTRRAKEGASMGRALERPRRPADRGADGACKIATEAPGGGGSGPHLAFRPLVARPPLDVEQRAPVALWTEQPLPLPGVAEPEGAAADGAAVHLHAAAR